MKFLRQKFYICLKLLIFNTYFIGFVLNFIAYFSTSWVKGETYTYGLFQYCKRVKESTTTGAVVARGYLFNYKGVDTDNRIDLKSSSISNKCSEWTEENAPIIISRSVYLMSFGLVFHFVSLIIVVLYTIVQHKNAIERNKRVLYGIKRNIRVINCFSMYNLLGSICGFIISTLYGANLILFILNHIFNKLNVRHEEISWCFTVSFLGFILTVVSTCSFSVYVFYFKMCKTSCKASTIQRSNSEPRVDLLKSYNNIDTIFQKVFIPTSLQDEAVNINFPFNMTSEYSIHSYPFFTSNESTKLWHKTLPPRKFKSSFTLKETSFFKRRASSLNEKLKKISNVKEIFKTGREKKYDKKVDDFFLNKITNRIEPSAFKICPQVQSYPTDKEKNNLNYTMKTLPYGSLSGASKDIIGKYPYRY